jgi:hypothetical protein
VDGGRVLDGLVLGATQAKVAGVAFGPMVNALVALVLFATMLVVLRRWRGRPGRVTPLPEEPATKR